MVQARMSSSRLPGKVLRLVGSQPLLGVLLERLRRCVELDGLLVATSVAADDLAIERFCRVQRIPVFRGSLPDVAGRFLAAAESCGCDAFVRVCADSPLLDGGLVDAMVRRFRARRPDLLTNVSPRRYPSGQSVELVSVAAFRRARAAMEPRHSEHVTAYFYEHPDAFDIDALDPSFDWSDVRMVVDSAEDLQVMTLVFAGFERPHWTYDLAALVPRFRALRPSAEGW